MQNLTARGSVIASLASSSNTQENGDRIYRVGSSGTVYIYNSSNLDLSTVDLTTFGPLSKVQATNTEDVIAVSAQGFTVTLNRTAPGTYSTAQYASAL